MTRLLPYPLLAAALLVMWVLLNGLSPGQVLLGALVAIGASRTMPALQPVKPHIRRWSRIPQLFGIVLLDIVSSNIAVAKILLRPRGKRVSGFVSIPLAIQDRTALAVLACIMTATPGTAWVEYRSRRDTLLIHVLELVDEQDWIDLIKERYEPLLMEIFE